MAHDCLCGSALVEAAILLPIYCLLGVAVLYFAGIGLMQQELGFLARYSAEDPTATMPVADQNVTIPITSAGALADGEFARWNGTPQIETYLESPLTAAQALEELITVSFRAIQGTQMDSGTGELSQETTTEYSREGSVLFGLGILYWMDDDIILSVDAEIAGEVSAWFSRRGVTLSTEHDAPLYQGNWGPTEAWNLAGLPVPALSGRVYGVSRSVDEGAGTVLTRSLGHSYGGEHPASYLFAQYWGGPSIVEGYPDYGASGNFWIRN